MTSPPRNASGDERGFVLVGVVVFVLALTILGLSLFSLSSYEAQFLGGSIREVQAFNDASAAIERTQFALIATEMLSSAQSVPGYLRPNVVYSRALRLSGDPGDSSLKINWTDGIPIEITAIAMVGNTRRLVKAQFAPSKAEDNFKRLLTSWDGITVDAKASVQSQGGGGGDGDGDGGGGGGKVLKNRYVSLEGETWQNNSDFAWVPIALGNHPRHPRGGVPVPEAQSFIDANITGATDPVKTSGGSSVNYQLTKPGVRFYKTKNTKLTENSVLHTDMNKVIRIQVSGRVVWLVPRGMRFDRIVTVKGNSGSCLVIVTTPNPNVGGTLLARQTGIAFNGGLDSNVPVFLISSGRVVVEPDEDNEDDIDAKTFVGNLSIYASSIQIGGPIADGSMSLVYQTGVMDPLVDQLYALGMLPTGQTVPGPQLKLIAGSWTQDPN